jgi:hypothetical protein
MQPVNGVFGAELIPRESANKVARGFESDDDTRASSDDQARKSALISSS